MSRALREATTPLYWLALCPFVASAIVWWQEITWFQSWGAGAAVELVSFVVLCALAIWLPSVAVYGQVRSMAGLAICSLLMAAAAGLVSRQAVVALVSYGYNTELKAYTNLVALVASKRGLMFVLCAALCPVLLAVLVAVRRSGQAKQAPSNAASGA